MEEHLTRDQKIRAEALKQAVNFASFVVPPGDEPSASEVVQIASDVFEPYIRCGRDSKATEPDA